MIVCLVLGLLISLFTIPLVLLPRLMDSIPGRSSGGRRSVRPRPTTAPRFGGMVLVSCFLGVVVLTSLLQPVAVSGSHLPVLNLVWAALAMAALGAWDDHKRLSTPHKFLLQAAVAGVLYLTGVQAEKFRAPLDSAFCLESLSNGFVTILWLVSLTNLVGVIDRVSGLAGAVSLALMTVLALAGRWAGTEFSALCASGMAGALIGFVIYNLPPSRIRLGGSGSGLLGFLLAALTMLVAAEGTTLATSLTPFIVITLLVTTAGFAVLRRTLVHPSRPPHAPRAKTAHSAPVSQRRSS